MIKAKSETIHKGDSYYLPVKITQGSIIYTPDNCQGVKIKVGDILQSYPGQIIFDQDIMSWKFFLTQEQSLGLCDITPLQVQVKIDDTTILSSDVSCIEVKESIITGVW